MSGGGWALGVDAPDDPDMGLVAEDLARGPPVVAPLGAVRDGGAGVTGTLTLHTDLLGDLSVPESPSRSGAAGAAELEALAARAAVYATRARGEGTRRVYRSAWRAYAAWCRSLGRQPLAGAPELVAMYATRRADQGVALSTLRVDLAAIRTAHLLAGVALDMRPPWPW